MKLVDLSPDDLTLSPELSRSGRTKTFEDRLRSSIDEMGLAEPLKVAATPDGGYLVIDGAMRLRAVRAIREQAPTRFVTISAYVLDYDKRFEIRYQSDIYQDLLPSQLATLVEHLHKAESVRKIDIARFIGVSPATLRNYTGLGRLLERGSLFARIVELMDVGVLPASNPYAWLRLTEAGLRQVLIEQFAEGGDPDEWIDTSIRAARLGTVQRFPVKYIELVTAALPAYCYRVGEETRAIKRDLGLRRAINQPQAATSKTGDGRLRQVSNESDEPVLRTAAQALLAYLA